MSKVWSMDTAEQGAVPRVWESGGDLTVSMMRDLVDGVGRWRLWGLLGWQDVSMRYRRSLLGPFWLTISMGVMVLALSLIYGTILKADLRHYLPYLTVGFLVWGLLQSTVAEGCQTFIEAEGLIRQIDLPLSMFPLRVAWRNLIILMHNAVIYLLVIAFQGIDPGWTVLLALPGLLVLMLNVVWVATLLGLLSARYRDIPQIATSLMQVFFFITPIIWTPEQMSSRPLIVEANPFYHFVELVRSPLLGHLPSLTNWLVVLAVTAIGGSATLLLYRRFHVRIAYWV